MSSSSVFSGGISNNVPDQDCTDIKITCIALAGVAQLVGVWYHVLKVADSIACGGTYLSFGFDHFPSSREMQFPKWIKCI